MSTAEAPVKTHTIRATNVGPIARVELEFPNSGVCVLKGKPGKGKSTLLGALDSAVTGGKAEYTVHDRELHSQLEAFGLTIRKGAKTTRSGEAEVHGISGVDIGTFINPHIDKPEAADAARIRALVRLSGQSADTSLFHDLVGGKHEFERLLPGVGIDEDDLLKLSGRIKRGLEEAARKAESAADQERGHALACDESAKSVDLTAESDPQVLQRSLESALQHKTQIEQSAVAAMRTKTKYDAAVKALSAAQAEMLAQPTVEDTKAREATALEEKNAAAGELEAARRALALAESRAKLAQQEWLSAVDARSSAESRKAAMSGWEEAVKNGAGAAMPTEEELEASSTRATEARKAVEQGALIRKARVSQEDSVKHLEKAQGHGKEAERLRNAAGGIDGVLSGVVSRMGNIVRVESDRLVTDTARGKTFVADLSDGERCRLGMHLFLDRLGILKDEAHPVGYMKLDQGFWGELPPSVKVEIAEIAREFGVLVVTAEATDDEELTAEVL